MDDFQEFWNVWPKRCAKADARKAWAQTKDIRPELTNLLNAVKAACKTEASVLDETPIEETPMTTSEETKPVSQESKFQEIRATFSPTIIFHKPCKIKHMFAIARIKRNSCPWCKNRTTIFTYHNNIFPFVLLGYKLVYLQSNQKESPRRM